MRKSYAHYHPDTDSMMIHLSDEPSVESEEIAEDVVLAYDKSNQVVAIEIVSGARELFAELIDKKPVAAEAATGIRRKGRKLA